MRSAIKEPKGYQESIARVKTGREIKEKKKKLLEQFFLLIFKFSIPRGENYERMRTAPVEDFSFLKRKENEKKKEKLICISMSQLLPEKLEELV